MAKKRTLSPVITERLKKFSTGTDIQSINAAKELFQELALLGLFRAGFFTRAAFQGGTALRLFYGLPRFYEDLDFALIDPDPSYKLAALTEPLRAELEAWGLDIEIIERNKASAIVKKAFLKDTSLAAELSLQSPLANGQKFAVKIELDTNPPAGAKIEARLCEYPVDFYVSCHDESSLFAGKLHAILCRPYLKGRDWYDLLFYFTRKTTPNFALLTNALKQAGPFKDEPWQIDPRSNKLDGTWLKARLEERFAAVDFKALKADVLPFVEDPRSVELWSRKLFADKMRLWEAHQN